MIVIDGSLGEGGGQILRSSLALSLVTGRPFRIHRIRAGRGKPGLQRQHLVAVQAAAAVGEATVTGASLGSQDLTFQPGPVKSGDYVFPIGSAGSTTLVLQTVLPPLLMAGGRSRVRIQGGTHNPHAPPYDFVEKTFVPLLARMGASVRLTLERRGFYPAGGGAIVADIESAAWRRLDLGARGPIEDMRARAILIRLPRHVAERELALAARSLTLHASEIDEAHAGPSPGNALMIEIRSSQVTELITGFGERGVAAERVAETAVQEALRYLASDAAVGEHLADQLLIPMALAGGGSMITVAPSLHTQTNIDVVKTFLDVAIRLVDQGDTWRLDVEA